MMRIKPVAALVALLCLVPPVVGAATDDDVAALRAELQALKADYSTRLGALQARIEQLEAAPANVAAAAAPAAVAAASPMTAPLEPTARSASAASAFNPAISLILTGNYTATSRDPQDWHIAGFMRSGDEIGPGERSFNLDESELALTSNVDPYFSATLIAAISGDDEIGVEEAYFRTLALPSGFTAKGGRFFSSFGYLNEVHSHAWDFIDQPLVYQAFFDNQLTEDGVQVKWLAPTDMFIELGAETANGDQFPGTRRSRNALNGGTLFAHVGGDVGDSTTWRAGVSWLDQHAEDRAFDDSNDIGAPVTDAFTGRSRTWVVDGVLKWAPYGNATGRQLKLQGEYMRRKEHGQLTFDTTGLGLSDAYRSDQSGWYLQSVYQFLPRWRVGLRYDSLDSGTPRIALVNSGVLTAQAFQTLLPARPDRLTLMFDWNPSEFSRIRAQYGLDDARDQGSRDRQFHLQYIYSIGAHGAHKY